MSLASFFNKDPYNLEVGETDLDKEYAAGKTGVDEDEDREVDDRWKATGYHDPTVGLAAPWRNLQQATNSTYKPVADVVKASDSSPAPAPPTPSIAPPSPPAGNQPPAQQDLAYNDASPQPKIAPPTPPPGPTPDMPMSTPNTDFGATADMAAGNATPPPPPPAGGPSPNAPADPSRLPGKQFAQRPGTPTNPDDLRNMANPQAPPPPAPPPPSQYDTEGNLNYSAMPSQPQAQASPQPQQQAPPQPPQNLQLNAARAHLANVINTKNRTPLWRKAAAVPVEMLAGPHIAGMINGENAQDENIARARATYKLEDENEKTQQAAALHAAQILKEAAQASAEGDRGGFYRAQAVANKMLNPKDLKDAYLAAGIPDDVATLMVENNGKLPPGKTKADVEDAQARMLANPNATPAQIEIAKSILQTLNGSKGEPMVWVDDIGNRVKEGTPGAAQMTVKDQVAVRLAAIRDQGSKNKLDNHSPGDWVTDVNGKVVLKVPPNPRATGQGDAKAHKTQADRLDRDKSKAFTAAKNKMDAALKIARAMDNTDDGREAAITQAKQNYDDETAVAQGVYEDGIAANGDDPTGWSDTRTEYGKTANHPVTGVAAPTQPGRGGNRKAAGASAPEGPPPAAMLAQTPNGHIARSPSGVAWMNVNGTFVRQ